MMNAQLDWQQATGLAIVLTAGHLGLDRPPVPKAPARTIVAVLKTLSPYLRESAVIAALYALWQLAGNLSFGASGAYTRSQQIVRIEQLVRFPSERDLQRWVMHHPILAQGSNLYYAAMHFGMLAALLVWLFVWHRDRYRQVRAALVFVTAACLLLQLIPVAPPRLLPELGFVDVAAHYGQSVYALRGISIDQLGAMPSVHVAWAVLVAWAVVTRSSSRWRWLILAHPLLTVFVVVATGNHFWLDGAVAVILLAAAQTAQGAWLLKDRTYIRYCDRYRGIKGDHQSSREGVLLTTASDQG